MHEHVRYIDKCLYA